MTNEEKLALQIKNLHPVSKLRAMSDAQIVSEMKMTMKYNAPQHAAFEAEVARRASVECVIEIGNNIDGWTQHSVHASRSAAKCAAVSITDNFRITERVK